MVGENQYSKQAKSTSKRPVMSGDGDSVNSLQDAQNFWVTRVVPRVNSPLNHGGEFFVLAVVRDLASRMLCLGSGPSP